MTFVWGIALKESLPGAATNSNTKGYTVIPTGKVKATQVLMSM
jgi:hypothetical protein